MSSFFLGMESALFLRSDKKNMTEGGLKVEDDSRSQPKY